MGGERVDESRGEEQTDAPDDKRRLTARLWYPTARCTGVPRAAYMSPEEGARAVRRGARRLHRRAEPLAARWRAKRTLGLRSVEDALVGAITVIQRSDGALRTNPHFHTIALDGVELLVGEIIECFRKMSGSSCPRQVTPDPPSSSGPAHRIADDALKSIVHPDAVDPLSSLAFIGNDDRLEEGTCFIGSQESAHVY